MRSSTDGRLLFAFIFGFVGGLIVLVSGVVVGAALLIVGTLSPQPLLVFGGLLSILIGVPIILGSVMLLLNTSNHVPWGIMVIVFSLASWITPSYGGFLVGLVLGVLGGLLSIIWRPPTVTPANSKD